MVDDIEPAPRRRLGAHRMALRRRRIFAGLREGQSYDEIAEDEGLSVTRIRQIVSEVLRKRLVDSGSELAKLQLERLGPVMQLAADAVAAGDVSAITPYLKVLDRFDRYQAIAGTNQVYDDEARKKLMDKLNRVAANPGSMRNTRKCGARFWLERRRPPQRRRRSLGRSRRTRPNSRRGRKKMV